MTEEEFLIRQFQKSDLDDTLSLLPRCFAEEFEVSGFDPTHVRDMVNRAFGITGRLFLASSRLVGKEPIRFLVADAKNEVVGTTIVSREGKVGYISAVMVSPDHRRKGIATKLMMSAVEYIRKRGMKRAVLHVVSTNAPAMGVYSRLGFEPFEEISHLVGEIGKIGSVPVPHGADRVEARPFRRADLSEVYDLNLASEDQNHLKVFDFNKSQLKTSILERLFRFSTQRRIVAVRARKLVGSVSAAYTTPKEAGRISSIQVRPEDRSRGVENVLVSAALNEIRKGGITKVVATVPTTRPEVIEMLNGLGLKGTMVHVGMARESR
jgi:ribosomal protein S18 acetylase RimI-like enzyme